MPKPEEVKALYQAAAAEPPLRESAGVAELFSALYRGAVESERVTCASAREEGRLVGFAYGHAWSWREQSDSWSRQLNDRLGANAALLDETFVISLLARDPSAAGRGLGAQLLDALIASAAPSACWLQTTDVESPARRLYAGRGLVPIGHGPDAPDGRPGLVMFRPSGASHTRH